MYRWTADSYLSPVAISPLRTRARFAGSLLIRLDPLHAVIGGVSVFILTHDNPPLGPAGTGARTLNTTDISHRAELHLDVHSRITKTQVIWKGPRQAWQTSSTTGRKAITRTSLGAAVPSPAQALGPQEAFGSGWHSALWFPKQPCLRSLTVSASLQCTEVLTDTTTHWEMLFFSKLQVLL